MPRPIAALKDRVRRQVAAPIAEVDAHIAAAMPSAPMVHQEPTTLRRRVLTMRVLQCTHVHSHRSQPYAFSRRTRFKRAAPEPLRLTDDDLAIIRHVAKHRFLRSTHLARLMPHRSYKKLIERLGALYHNGYLDRPRAQLDYYATAGSAPMVYALGNRGRSCWPSTTAWTAAEVDWTWKNRSVGRLFIDHTLLTADVMVAAECAARNRGNVQLMTAQQILPAAPETTRDADNPFKLKTAPAMAAS